MLPDGGDSALKILLGCEQQRGADEGRDPNTPLTVTAAQISGVQFSLSQ